MGFLLALYMYNVFQYMIMLLVVLLCSALTLSSSPIQGIVGKRKALMKSIELREKRKRKREELEVVIQACILFNHPLLLCVCLVCQCVCLCVYRTCVIVAQEKVCVLDAVDHVL